MSKISIAIIGVNGYLGKPIIKSLESSLFNSRVNFPIKAITRKPVDSTESVQYIVADIAETEVVAKYLEGVDVIIELVTSDVELFTNVEKIVTLVRPKLFIPSQFGADSQKIQKWAPGFFATKINHINNVRVAGIKTIDVTTNLFLVPGDLLYEKLEPVGVDVAANTVIQRGDLDQRFSVTHPDDIGNSVAALVTAHDFSKLPDLVKIQSTSVSFREVYDRYEKDHNVKLNYIAKYTYEEVEKEFNARWAEGYVKEDFLYYLHVLLSKGEDKGAYYNDDDNELVNPGESLWKWIKF